MQAKSKTLRGQYFKGLAIAFLGVIVLSFDAMFIQMADVNGFKAAFWRALFVAISTSILFLIKNKKNSINALLEGGKPLWFRALCGAVVASLLHWAYFMPALPPPWL